MVHLASIHLRHTQWISEVSRWIQGIVALVIAIAAVHLLYIGYIRPEAQLAFEVAKQAGQSAPRDLVVILKDLEQEVCLILMFWGLFLILEKCRGIFHQHYLFSVNFLEGSTNENGDLKSVLETLEGLTIGVRETPLVKILMASLRRFIITNDVQDTSDAIDSSIEALGVKQEAENSMIRYLIWAIPSIGFIGTVRGIGQALSQADQALAGDIAGMTNSLGIAFNSTFVALLISIILMLFLHLLQWLQDRQIVKTQEYCEAFLVNRISTVGRD